MYCLNMNNVVLPECEEIGKCAFYGDKNLVEVSIPRCKRICNGAFQFCNKIEKITLNECECIERLAFSGCSNLKEIHLYGDKKVLLDKPNAFDGTSSELKIFVKESLYDEYIASDDWRKWSSMISIEES